MAINYPTSKDTLTNPTATDKVSVVDHASQHSDVNDIVEALETKVGIDGDSTISSHDYKLSGVTGTDKAVSTGGNQTIAGDKTFSGTTTTDGLSAGSGDITTTGTVSGDIKTSIVKDTNNNESIKITATVSAVNNLDVVNSATGDDVELNATGDDTNINIVLKGKGSGTVKLGSAELNIPNTTGNSGDVLKTDGVDTLSFASVSSLVKPDVIGAGILYNYTVDDILSVYCDELVYIASNGTTIFRMMRINQNEFAQEFNITDTWADADTAYSFVLLNNYLYVLMKDSGTSPDTYRVYRYDASDVSSGGTLMTFSGSNQLTTTNSILTLTSDGTDFYINFNAGNSSNGYDITKYTLSGTTLTYSSATSYGSTSSTFYDFLVKANGDMYLFMLGAFDYVDSIEKYNSSGVLQSSISISNLIYKEILNYDDTFYARSGDSGNDNYIKFQVD